ncbi:MULTISPECIES: alanine--tRNA ligase [Aminobacterium]|jgi:alanyl-tRNA synthetase|uniref:Alanine--tRNA ligase n=1 Tax=Aminobacterium colombiense (strain DSM 12261 / ALA-1) TaxID=572547 RepID=D5EF21_AMICL|nr:MULTISPECIES: alanine--tRNA ligase [Aminobacterium]MDD2378354.1 alanine--tRNA ligase [Aminobacterium colombiense]ADE57153.1 alanyl-tRNA synthetase [Aminobacterium colombiense DSM 12261]MDD3767227.1 alanine--tRNA ligase [Aminobacterium colombiense]MDD4264817.1 alanine--tRNA ligase [Aminobacterium colombiense]MDD4585060.1 alanine--tRNA ligase [Aminobacterium colombiense]
MRWRTGKEIRSLFIDFWESKGSKHYPSFSLIPNDPSLLFTIAGMVPFKPYYLGIQQPEFTRAVTSQKCVRTNDIENVGRTARHHTFFEMLGNFSWGDYFKKEAITWGWEFLTEVIGLEPERLYATIYKDDEEAYSVWRNEVGLPENKIYRFDKDENFWFMGNTGPCGPCSEIIYDQGPEFSCGKPTCDVGCNCDRYLEIWNLVFTQFDLQEDGTLVPLPKKNIDTGMGLERLTSIVQRVRTDFETDLFKPLIDHICAMTGVTYGSSPSHNLAVRVIADHIRSVAFMIADGILPANDGRGYVLRRLIRRAARYGKLIGLDRPFLLELFPDVLDLMADPYRELLDNRPMIEQIVSMEEKRFGRTLQQGTELIEQEISRLRLRHVDALSGTIAFELYDTYGFPLELTTEICAENDIKVDEAGFHVEMEKQRERARASSKQLSSEMKGDVYSQIAAEKGQTSFEGYVLSELDTEVVALIKDGQPVDFLSEGESGEAVLKVSPFYAERGGEIGDQGLLSAAGVKVCVTDTTSETADLIVHRVTVLEGVLTEGLAVHASVDKEKRESIRRNHTATHLLHEALSQVLGSHVRQAGSLVNEALLRFDFTHFESMTREQIAAVEDMVNRQILKNIPLETIESDLEQAREMGAKALFDEKYGDIVRVVRIKDFSTELCGGLHVDATGDIGAFKIIKEEGIGSGTRRITALTGLNAFRAFQNSFRVVEDLCNVLTLTTDELVSHVENMQAEIKGLGRKIDELKLNNLAAAIDESVKKEILSNGTSIFQGSFKGVSADMLRELCDRIKVKNKNIVIVLASQISEENVLIVAMADDEAMKAGAHAGKIVKEVAVILGGGGGGKPAIAQAGGKKPEKIDEAFHALRGIVEKQMGV